MRVPDENMELRHHKRGILSMANDGENANGSEFFITFDKASMLDAYHTVFGELVEGEDVLQAAEKCVSRLGNLTNEIKIEKCGPRDN